ncbi:MFS transporter [Actinomadura barringtoniae]|uniref:MFS transporter n=1 Tax=Actinomadura barringtoniae TaxID=1427535 RepID=A0A939T5X3_9ACTN|nr:MFS transporter [Actinomadura barringtoniae]MBO2447607.1 MFS transporter [Actinomadura barringtoniae]
MGYLRLLKQPRILLLWSAQTASSLGDRMYALAVMWLMWETTHSAAWMGLVAVVESLPYVAVGIWGRRLLAAAASMGRLALVDVARMVAVGSLPVIWAVHGPSVTALLIVAALAGALGAVFDPVLGAMVPDLVSPDQVQQVTGLMDLMGRIARIAGPGAAGLLLAVISDAQLYLIDAATFAVSAAALAFLARHAPAADTSPASAARAQAERASAERASAERASGERASGERASGDAERRGHRARDLLRARPVTGLLVGLHGAGQLLLGVSLVMPALLERHGGGAQTFALVLAANGVGAVAANAVAGNLRLATVIPGAYCVAWMFCGVVMAGIGAAWTTSLIVALSTAAGAVGPFTAVGLRTHLAKLERTERLAWMTLDQTALRSAGTAGTLLLPVLAAPHPAAGFVGAGCVMVALAAATWAAGSMLTARGIPVEVPAPQSP